MLVRSLVICFYFPVSHGFFCFLVVVGFSLLLCNSVFPFSFKTPEVFSVVPFKDRYHYIVSKSNRRLILNLTFTVAHSNC